MTATAIPDIGLAMDLNTRRKQLRFRCWHRGTQELDLLLGHFADEQIDQLDTGLLGQLEALLNAPDVEVLGWVTAQADVPDAYRNELMDRLHAFDVSKNLK